MPSWALVQPHELLLLDVGGELFRTLSSAYAHALTSGLPPPPAHSSRDLEVEARGGGAAGRGAVVVGYLSSDFTAHATTHLLKGVFALHDVRKVVPVCLDLAGGGVGSKGSGSAWHSEVAQACRVVGVPAHTGAAASVIRSQHVHVLIDLNGWTAGQRVDVLHARTAPIQALYLGYPGTSGAAHMDYFFTDVTASPPDLSGHYSEKLVLLRDCYYVIHIHITLVECTLLCLSVP